MFIYICNHINFKLYDALCKFSGNFYYVIGCEILLTDSS